MIEILASVPAKLKKIISNLALMQVDIDNLGRPLGSGIDIFTTSGVWVKPSGIDRCRITAIAAGGGGGGIAFDDTVQKEYQSGGGGAGEKFVGIISLTADLNITIGLGGIAGVGVGSSVPPPTATKGGIGGDSLVTGGDHNILCLGGLGGDSVLSLFGSPDVVDRYVDGGPRAKGGVGNADDLIKFAGAGENFGDIGGGAGGSKFSRYAEAILQGGFGGVAEYLGPDGGISADGSDGVGYGCGAGGAAISKTGVATSSALSANGGVGKHGIVIIEY